VSREEDRVREAYDTGTTRFMGLTLQVAPGALVPREETELLGKAALDALAGREGELRVIDMCCGSGNLACAVASQVPTARVWACDLTDGCVKVAFANVTQLGLQPRVSVLQGDLFAALAGRGLEETVDVVVCNPPYISTGRLEKERKELLDAEPREAFDGGPYGLTIHQRVIKEALPFLRPQGTLLFEIGLGQERQLELLFRRANAYTATEQRKDDAGQVRVVLAKKV
jgi:release factor glutamine methyltransferase